MEQAQSSGLSLESFRAELEVFSGPLDLLLYLVKREEVDIFEVQLSRITEHYLAAVRTMQFLDINVAGDFLVMAATLMEIKSKALLPDAPEDEEEEQQDPAAELVRHLLQYKEFKEVSEHLSERARLQAQRFPRPRVVADEPEAEESGPPALLEELTCWDLMAAFAEVIEQTQSKRPLRIARRDVPVSVYVGEVLARLRGADGPVGFLEFFREEYSRARIIGIFLALLELVRRGAVCVEQDSSAAHAIRISLRQAAQASG